MRSVMTTDDELGVSLMEPVLSKCREMPGLALPWTRLEHGLTVPEATGVARSKEVITMNTINIVFVGAVIVMTAAAQGAWAEQSESPPRDGPVSVSALGGVSFGDDHTGAAGGITLGVDLNERVSLEGRAVYFDRGRGQSAVEVNAGVLVDLLAGGRAVPYLSAGGGLYRAMFDFGDGGSVGMMGGFSSVNGVVGPGQMPMFYARRFEAADQIGSGWHMQGFTDPALSVGGGVRFDLTSHVYLRPDVRALTIFGGRDTYTLGSATLSVGYRF